LVQEQGVAEPNPLDAASTQAVSTVGTVAKSIRSAGDGEPRVFVDAESDPWLDGVNPTEKDETQGSDAALTSMAETETGGEAKDVPNAKGPAPQPRKKKAAEWVPGLSRTGPSAPTRGPDANDVAVATEALANSETAQPRSHGGHAHLANPTQTTDSATRPAKSTARIMGQNSPKPRKLDRKKR